MIRRQRLILQLMLAIGVLGCGQKSSVPVMRVFPVSGKLTVNGQPAKGVTVRLLPKTRLADMRHSPIAVVSDDGSFKFTTYGEDDGAPAGAYSVLVGPGLEGMSDETRKILQNYQPKVSTTETIPVPAAEIVVKEEPNTLDPIDLKAR